MLPTIVSDLHAHLQFLSTDMKEPLLPLAETRAAPKHSPCLHPAVKILASIVLLSTAFLAVGLFCFPQNLLAGSIDLAKVTSNYQVCVHDVSIAQ